MLTRGTADAAGPSVFTSGMTGGEVWGGLENEVDTADAEVMDETATAGEVTEAAMEEAAAEEALEVEAEAALEVDEAALEVDEAALVDDDLAGVGTGWAGFCFWPKRRSQRFKVFASYRGYSR